MWAGLGVIAEGEYGVVQSIAAAIFASLGLSAIAFGIVWVVTRKWPPERPAVLQNQQLQEEPPESEDVGMNTPMDEAARLMQEMKESAKRDAARALEGFERRAERIEEGRPARPTPPPTQGVGKSRPVKVAVNPQNREESPKSLQEVLDRAKQREEERFRAAQEEKNFMQNDDDDSDVMVVHKGDIPKIKAMERLLNESFDREMQRTIKEAEAQEGHEPKRFSSIADSKQDHLAGYGEEMLRFIRDRDPSHAASEIKDSREDELFKAAFVPGPSRWRGKSPPAYSEEQIDMRRVLINLGRHAKRAKSAAPKLLGLKNILWLSMVAYFLVLCAAASLESEFTVVFLLLFVLNIIATVLAYAGASAVSRIGEVPRVLRDELLFTRRDIKWAASTLNDAELVRALGEREVFLQATMLEHMIRGK